MARSRTMRFCPDCGEQTLRPLSQKSWRCTSCEFVWYQNTAAAVAAIILHAGEVLFVLRARDPQAGKLDLPGGFVDNDESVEEALWRELAEELGLQAVHATYMASFPNTYPYAGMEYKTVDLIYLVELEDRPLLRLGDEVAGVRWINAGGIPFEQLAFQSVRRALTFFQTRWQGQPEA